MHSSIANTEEANQVNEGASDNEDFVNSILKVNGKMSLEMAKEKCGGLRYVENRVEERGNLSLSVVNIYDLSTTSRIKDYSNQSELDINRMQLSVQCHQMAHIPVLLKGSIGTCYLHQPPLASLFQWENQRCPLLFNEDYLSKFKEMLFGNQEQY